MGQITGPKIEETLDFDEVIEIAELNANSLHQILLSHSEDYQTSYFEELRLMTEIKDP